MNGARPPSDSDPGGKERRRNELLVKAASWLVAAILIALAVLLALLALGP